jgi:large subunit ribosomal protein L15
MRGGRGNAGLNKHRTMTRIKYMPKHYGMYGFNRDPSLRTAYNTCNVSELSGLIDKGDSVDLAEHGIEKLLGSGQISQAIHVTVEHASARAVEKVEAAGGSVTLDDGEEE